MTIAYVKEGYGSGLVTIRLGCRLQILAPELPLEKLRAMEVDVRSFAIGKKSSHMGSGLLERRGAGLAGLNKRWKLIHGPDGPAARSLHAEK